MKKINKICNLLFGICLEIVFCNLLFIIPAFAGNNLVFTCTDSSCEKSSSLPLFSENNIYPTYSVSQTTTIINNRSTNCNLNFKLINSQERDLLSTVLTVSSVTDSTVWYSGSIESLFDGLIHSLGQISANSQKIINWTTVFNQDAGNDYQNISNLFDMDFNFTCDDPPSPSNPDNKNQVPTCNDPAPINIPQNFTAISGQNSVTLNWTKPEGNFTYYLIAFGENQNADKYGNPNIGGPNTTSYTVNNLSSGTTYYFKIRTGNGCSPGGFSQIISASPLGQVLVNPIVPSGFQEGVLGEQTTMPNLIETPSILGNSTSTTCPQIFKLVFILILLINLLFKKQKFISFVLSGLLILFDYYFIDKSCRFQFWYLIDLFSFVFPFLILN